MSQLKIHQIGREGRFVVRRRDFECDDDLVEILADECGRAMAAAVGEAVKRDMAQNDEPAASADIQAIYEFFLLADQAMRNGDFDAISRFTLAVGAALQRLSLRPGEKDIEVRTRFRAASKAAHEERYGTTDEKSRRQCAMQKRLNELVCKDDVKLTAARRRVAREFGVSEKTVQRRTKRPLPNTADGV